MDMPRNMTGLYLGGFIQEGYLPPRERKSTIPSTFYRGHVVKLARAPNSNPHRSSVGRYPMHSLNSGFAGLTVPIKDQMNFKNPDEMIHERKRTRAKGKWANYPMSIEIKKIAGSGSSGSYLAKCVLGENSTINSNHNIDEDTRLGRFKVSPSPSEGRIGSSLYGIASPDQRDKDEERFYQSMYDEIRHVVAGQENAMQTNRVRLQRILMNDSSNNIRPDVVSPAHRNNRVSTSYGFSSPRRNISPQAPRPHTTAALPRTSGGTNRCLLLPVPYVSNHNWQVSTPSVEPPRTTPIYDFPRGGVVTPYMPHLSAVSPFAKTRPIKPELYYRGDKMRWNSPEPALPVSRGNGSHANIGNSHIDRLNRLLNAAEKEGNETPHRNNVTFNVTSLLQTKDAPKKSMYLTTALESPEISRLPSSSILRTPTSSNIQSPSSPGRSKVDVQTSPDTTPPLLNTSYSVVVPASYDEPPSLTTSPLPPYDTTPIPPTGTPVPPSETPISNPEDDTSQPQHNMGSASVKLLNMTENKTTEKNDHVIEVDQSKPVLTRADSEIRCVVEGDDGSQIPADIDQDVTSLELDRKCANTSTRIIMDEIESQAELKRNELRMLLIEHQQIVSEIRRLELWKTKQITT